MFLVKVFLVSLHGNTINVSVQYNGELLPDVILLTQCNHHLSGNQFKYQE